MHVGATLGGRFTLVRTETYDVPGVDRFVANDARLGTEVTVDVVTALAPSAVRSSAARAALVRDPRIARVLATGRADGDVTYVVSARARGVRLDSILDTRVLPVDMAAAIIGEAARGLIAAAGRGQHHGYVRPAAITVAPRGKVMLTGLGIDGELATQASVERGKGTGERADARALARLFVSAVSGKTATDTSAADIPAVLRAPLAALVASTIAGNGPSTLRELVHALEPFSARTLVGFAAAAAEFAPTPALIEAERIRREEAAELAAQIAREANAAVQVSPASLATAAWWVEQDLAYLRAEPGALEAVSRVRAASSVVARRDEDLDDLDTFKVIAAEQTESLPPAVWEDVLTRLHERWPQSERLTHTWERASARANRAGPIKAGPLLMSLGVVAVVVVAIMAFSSMNQPFVPDFELNNPPANTYPPFTFSPSPSPTVSPTLEDG